ncbi:MAG: sugar ABC transporter ATP-binding protein [Lachnospiraceae bacterium]|nr:sugar ABC transporter ATP-binding protein [Lachnospiraceae bacterium]
MEYILEMKDIQKSFPGVRALKGITFQLKPGEIHSLMGENGAGKSTLIKILTGVYKKDGGTILFDGREVEINSTIEAQNLGISTVYQELNMIPYLSVGENIFLGRYPKKGKAIDWKKLYEDAGKLLRDMGLNIKAEATLNSYGTAAQQMVSIARAISLNCKVIVLDEPTSSLDTDEVKMLFSIVRDLKKKNIAVIFISHRLDEVYEISDRITILKDGEYEGTYGASELSQNELITKMVGREIEQKQKIERSHKNSGSEMVIELDKIVSKPKLKNISINIKRGEIVGLAGLLGAGRTETAQVIFGYTTPDAGTIKVKGEKVTLKTPRDGLSHKMAFCTENRREEGIIPNMSVYDNIVLSSLKTISHHGFLNRAEGDRIVKEYIERFHIKTPGPKQKIKNLSGGNQQKVILARWLATNPDFIIFDEPTRGIDVGAKRDVENLVAEIADMGLGVLLISSEMSELARNCDRVYVLRDGVVVGEVSGEEIRQENITKIIAEGRHGG